jgi:hypothetical protein
MLVASEIDFSVPLDPILHAGPLIVCAHPMSGKGGIDRSLSRFPQKAEEDKDPFVYWLLIRCLLGFEEGAVGADILNTVRSVVSVQALIAPANSSTHPILEESVHAYGTRLSFGTLLSR